MTNITSSKRHRVPSVLSQHIRLKVSGRVQGVGFRPFVYQLATALDLKGTVCNTASGVTIHLLGTVESLANFEEQLTSKAPVHARLHRIEKESLPLAGYETFRIIESQTSSELNPFVSPEFQCNQISPDMGVCESCLTEFNDPHNRRYLDPFINCSDCGPRYTMMSRLPYERQNTAMNAFEPCSDCLQSYQNPLDRRYHTQGICCPQCGPKISLYSAENTWMAEGLEAIHKVAEVLKKAGLVAFKSVGGFHLLCDATNDEAVAKLRQRKQRASKPLAVLCANIEMALKLGEISQHEQILLSDHVKPIVLVNKKPQNGLSKQVAPDTHRLGLFLAYTPLQHLLFQVFNKPLIATSANLSGEPILYQKEHVFEKLCRGGGEIIDCVLDVNREIINPCDDSILQSIDGQGIDGQTTVVLRLSRGLAPYYGALPKPVVTQPLLAVGAQQKSSVAFADQNYYLLSPYIGDLHTIESQQRFKLNIQSLQRLTQTPFKQLICDAHPDYASSQWAKNVSQQHGLPLSKVGHHYAHVLACMAEFQLNEPVLAFSWDGMGLGDDGTLWGGEIFLATAQTCHRVNHLKAFKMLGGDLANQQPRRVALSLLFDLMPLKIVLSLELPTVQAFTEFEIYQLHKMHQANLNSPLTSSMGRLFDAVASLLGLTQQLDYEGQSGLILEALYDASVIGAYDVKCGDDYSEDGIANNQINIEPMVWQIIEDLQQGRPKTEMASRFLNMLVNLIEKIASQFSDFPVVVTGGVFQNQTLLNLLCKRFKNKSQTLYFQQQTPINDGAIALGQLWWAMHINTKSENSP